jgi:starch synthase
MHDSSRLNVLFAASEAAPFVKVGGLADVAGSLPHALKNLSQTDLHAGPTVDIRLVIPFHPQIRQEDYSPQLIVEFPIPSKRGEVIARVYTLEDNGLTVYLIAGSPIDEEDGVYSADLEADGYKYVFFSMATLEMAKRLGWMPDILHANDWHTATAVYALSLARPAQAFYTHTASLLTIHNLPYLGSMTPPAMQAFGLPPADAPDLPSWARYMALPLGLLGADAIVAVSPGYASEIMTAEFGSGLDDYLEAHASKISGVLNGLDIRKWDPATDVNISVNFSATSLDERLTNKVILQKEMGLEISPRIPLLSMVTRMDPQKGVDLAVEALRSMLKKAAPGSQPLQMVFLGTGNPVLEDETRLLEQEFANSVRTRIEFNEPLSHHIYAGADALLMPSRYEPCGLSQMIAMHYGCVPIARATGGLSDTIYDPSSTDQSTGFLFSTTKPEALVSTIQRALGVFQNDPTSWQEMQVHGMQQDFSWDRSALAYMKHYISVLR